MIISSECTRRRFGVIFLRATLLSVIIVVVREYFFISDGLSPETVEKSTLRIFTRAQNRKTQTKIKKKVFFVLFSRRTAYAVVMARNKVFSQITYFDFPEIFDNFFV